MKSSPRINIYDLNRVANSKREREYLIHDRILMICHQKIKEAAEYGYLFAVFQVPHFLYGSPVFCIDRCTAAIISSLRRDHFTVNYVYPYKLNISWKLHDDNKETDKIERKSKSKSDDILKRNFFSIEK